MPQTAGTENHRNAGKSSDQTEGPATPHGELFSGMVKITQGAAGARVMSWWGFLSFLSEW